MQPITKMGPRLTPFLRALTTPTTIYLVVFIMLAFVQPTLAEDFTLPKVDIGGVDSDSTATEIVVAIIKYAFKFALWLIVLIASGVFLKNTVKSIAKARKDEDSKWGEVIGDIAGNSVVVILIIALASWVDSLLN